jgi:hypothetical protein
MYAARKLPFRQGAIVLVNPNDDCRGDYCCLRRSGANPGFLELSMSPPAATAHY